MASVLAFLTSTFLKAALMMLEKCGRFIICIRSIFYMNHIELHHGIISCIDKKNIDAFL